MQISNETKTKIKKQVNETFKTKINSGFQRILINSKTLYLSYLLLGVGILLFVIMLFVKINEDSKSEETKTTNILVVLGIAGIIVVSIGAILLFLCLRIKSKVKSILIASSGNFYNSIAQDNNKDLAIKSISSEFHELKPQSFVPRSGVDVSVWTEKVIDGNFLKQDFSLGTIIERITHRYYDEKSKTTRENYTYNRYMYLVIQIEPYDYVTTIKPEGLLDKVFQRNKVKLESAEFEKMFAVDYSDPIKLRKLFEPKVMADMVDYGQSVKKLPHISLDIDTITLMVPYKNISGTSSAKGDLIHFRIRNNANATVDNIVTTIDNDLTTLLSMVKWVQILKLI